MLLFRGPCFGRSLLSPTTAPALAVLTSVEVGLWGGGGGARSVVAAWSVSASFGVSPLGGKESGVARDVLVIDT